MTSPSRATAASRSRSRTCPCSAGAPSRLTLPRCLRSLLQRAIYSIYSTSTLPPPHLRPHLHPHLHPRLHPASTPASQALLPAVHGQPACEARRDAPPEERRAQPVRPLPQGHRCRSMWHRHAYACTGCTYTLQAHCKHTVSTLQAHCKHCKHAACTLHVHTHVHVHLHVHVCTALGPSSVAACPTAPRSRQPLRSARAALWAREREGPCHGCTPYGDTYYGDTYYGDTYYGYGRHLLWRHLLWLWATLAMATSAGLPYTES